ncbi:MAG: KEOPS complex N(6)-L-threonylcarbamoyladenine synthase Kae1 [Nanoarchaeota archaeon]
MPTIIGIESTAHTFGIGIVRNGKILSNKRKMYTTESGGIIPMDSAKHHQENKWEIYFEALTEAGLNPNEENLKKEINAIAFSQSPGLAPCLIQGKNFAIELSKKFNKPLIGVNHCVAHLEIGRLTGCKDPVMLYASGANTQVIAYEFGKYRIFGETLDLGVGNFIDTIARSMGLGFPGGPKIQKLAEKSSKENYIELPYTVKGQDISLSGLQTKLRQLIKSEKYKISDIAYSLQETVFAMLIETAERALAHTGKKELLLGGGVACNSRLQEMCKIMCKERGAKFFCPEKSLLVDNAAMIAYLGEIMFKSKSNIFQPTKLNKVDILPRQRTDDIEVKWR